MVAEGPHDGFLVCYDLMHADAMGPRAPNRDADQELVGKVLLIIVVHDGGRVHQSLQNVVQHQLVVGVHVETVPQYTLLLVAAWALGADWADDELAKGQGRHEGGSLGWQTVGYWVQNGAHYWLRRVDEPETLSVEVGQFLQLHIIIK